MENSCFVLKLLFHWVYLFRRTVVCLLSLIWVGNAGHLSMKFNQRQQPVSWLFFQYFHNIGDQTQSFFPFFTQPLSSFNKACKCFLGSYWRHFLQPDQFTKRTTQF